MRPLDTPFGPGYDSECAEAASSSSAAAAASAPASSAIGAKSVSVLVEHIGRLVSRTGTFDTLLSEANVTVEDSGPTTIQLNQVRNIIKLGMVRVV